MNKYQRLCCWLSHLQLQGFTPPQPDWKHKSKLHMWRNTVWSSCKQVRVFPCSEYFGFSKSIRIGTSCIEWLQDHNATVNGSMEPVIWFRGTFLWFLQWVLPIHCKFFTCGIMWIFTIHRPHLRIYLNTHIASYWWSPHLLTMKNSNSKVSIRMRIDSHPKFLVQDRFWWTVLGQAGWQATWDGHIFIVDRNVKTQQFWNRPEIYAMKKSKLFLELTKFIHLSKKRIYKSC